MKYKDNTLCVASATRLTSAQHPAFDTQCKDNTLCVTSATKLTQPGQLIAEILVTTHGFYNMSPRHFKMNVAIAYQCACGLLGQKSPCSVSLSTVDSMLACHSEHTRLVTCVH